MKRIPEFLMFVLAILALVGSIADIYDTRKAHAKNVSSTPIGAQIDSVYCDPVVDSKLWWEVKNCPAVNGPTLTSIINSIGERADALTHCGEWGAWITDKQGQIMGRYRNPACPGDANDGRYGVPDSPRCLCEIHLKRNGANGNYYWIEDRGAK